jgi:hypothetical protein
LGSERTSAGAQLAASALARLAAASGDHARELLVVGGLTPPLLAGDAPVGHLGTTDIDVLVEVALPYEEDDEGADYGWLERALRDAGFEPVGAGATWATRAGPRVTIDLVCDRPGTAPGAMLTIRGCTDACGSNLLGPRAARCDAVTRTLPVPGSSATVDVPFAGLGGFLLAKASAASIRQVEKDFYDFYYVVIHNDAGGPRAAGEAMRAGGCGAYAVEFADAVTYVLREAVRGDRPAAAAYATSMERAGDDTDPDVLREDATSAAYAVARVLGLDLP